MNMKERRDLDETRRPLTGLLHLLLQRKSPSTSDLNLTLDQTVRRLGDALGADAVALLLHGAQVRGVKERFLYVGALRTEFEYEARERIAGVVHAWEQQPVCTTPDCPCAIAEKTTKPVIVGREQSTLLCLNHILKSLNVRTRCAIVLPIVLDNKAVGTLTLVNGAREDSFSAADQQVLIEAADAISKLLRRADNPTPVLTDVESADILARLSRCAFVRIGPDYALDMPMLKQFNEDHLKRYSMLPLQRLGERDLRVALSNPQDFQRISDFEIATGQRVLERVVTPECEIRLALERAFPVPSKALATAQQIASALPADEATPFAELAEDSDENSAPIVNLSRQIIEEAYTLGASDIHVEPFESKLVVRYRIDGVCREKLILPRAAHRPLVARLKIMSDLDIAEHRLTQDGRIVFKRFSPQFDLDLRVSVVPANYGESIVMRILDKTRSTLPLEKLGFSNHNLTKYRELIATPYGMLLHCGPTGSGKSMTLYAALNEINSPELKILTAEDPIEYTLPRIIQMQIRKDIGLTFSAALRAFLRQDPDIILVGEIRDHETAEIAVEASLTGHLLFSTLHTNDAPTAVTRLTDIGIEPFLISSTLIAICAQRLVRRLCKCKQARELTPDDRALLERAGVASPTQLMVAGACALCDSTGYKGRTGIHELLATTDVLRESIAGGATAESIKELARQNGMRTLFEDAMAKVATGITSLREALAVVAPDEAPFAQASNPVHLARGVQQGGQSL